jgi:hypothetical protein
MKTAIIKSNGVRDSTEEKVTHNWAAEYAKRLVEKEAAARKSADDKHASERASDTQYSHVRLSDSVSSTSDVNNAVAATPKAVKTAYDKAVEGVNNSAEVSDKLNTEIAERKGVDRALDAKIATEINMRAVADTALQNTANNLLKTVGSIKEKLNTEERERRTNDNILMGNVEILFSLAHKHGNKDILDSITAERMKIWDTVPEFEGFRVFVQQMLYGNINQFRDIYSALGVKQYDGGLFGMEYEGGAHLDGGSFNDTEIRQIVDEGDFTPRSVVPPLTERVTELETMFGLLESELDKINGEEI